MLRRRGMLESYIEYCRRDTVSLLVSLETLRTVLRTMFSVSVPTQKQTVDLKLTTGAIAKDAWEYCLFTRERELATLMKRREDVIRHAESGTLAYADIEMVATQERLNWSLIRKSVVGGTSICRRGNGLPHSGTYNEGCGQVLEPLTSYDVNSQYPSVLSSDRLFIVGATRPLGGEPIRYTLRKRRPNDNVLVPNRDLPHGNLT